MSTNLSKLSEPFSSEDVEWRVSRAGTGQRGIYCMVFAYITARAIQKRLDDVCGVDGWKNEKPVIVEVNGKLVFASGISIRINDEWVTKWDVSDQTNIEPAKGGFSGSMKRAGAQWGIGRYLYHLEETFAEVTDEKPKTKGWNHARLPEKQGGATYFWQTPSLPGWAIPKEPEHEITEFELNDLKKEWKGKFGADIERPKDLRDGFTRFVMSIVGEFPVNDFSCWSRDALEQCQKQIEANQATQNDSETPFE